MKHLLLSISLLLAFNLSFCQPQVSVDERFELTSIVFRLTDDVAFVHSNPANYIKDIDDYFSEFKNHELIAFVKKTMYSKSILDISLPAFFAGDIKITKNGIVWTDEWTTTFELYDTLPDSKKWTKAELNEYLRLLNKFYKDSKFHKFYTAHADFYSSIEKSFEDIAGQIDTSWFYDFFGKPYEMDNIWLIPTNGYFNFSVNRIDHDGREHHNCAISGIFTDSLNIPHFHYNTFKTLIHEICHNYNNPICKKYENDLKNVCDTLYTFVGKWLSEEYYGDPSAITYEGFNRLCEYSYYLSHKTFTDSLLYDCITTEEYKGFIWFGEMLHYLNIFETSRELYPHFEDFVPQLKLFLEQTVGLMENYYLPKHSRFRPIVVATYPACNSIVDTTLKKVVILFSKPMQLNTSVQKVKDTTATLIPGKWEDIYWENEYSYVIPLKEALKPNSKYGFRVSEFFGDAIDYFGAIPYDLIFETK